MDILSVTGAYWAGVVRATGQYGGMTGPLDENYLGCLGKDCSSPKAKEMSVSGCSGTYPEPVS